MMERDEVRRWPPASIMSATSRYNEFDPIYCLT